MLAASAPQRELRGSQKLLENLARNGDAVSVDEIKKVLRLTDIKNVKIPSWLIRGQPPAFLELQGTIEVPIASLSEVVDRFVKVNDSAISLDILINGIPFPELAQIRVRNIPGPR